MQNLKISIIIPIYNVEPYLFACLSSVAGQTMHDGIECILIDDCGTDKSVQVAERFMNDYRGDIDFSIIHHKQNQGLSAARNTGLLAAQGEYIFFLDSDDEITPNCVGTLFSIAEEHPGIDLIQGSYLADTPYFNQFNQIKFPNYTDDKALIKKSLLNYNVIPVMAQNRLVRRDLILEHNLFFKKGIIHEDNHWTFFIAKYVKTMALCPEKTYKYNITPGSITNNINLEKEILAFHTMINDFCANVDNDQMGAQRLCIYLLLDRVRKSKYYDSIESYKALYCKFRDVCNPIERLFLRMWNQASVSSPQYKRAGNILQHLFKL